MDLDWHCFNQWAKTIPTKAIDDSVVTKFLEDNIITRFWVPLKWTMPPFLDLVNCLVFVLIKVLSCHMLPITIHGEMVLQNEATQT